MQIDPQHVHDGKYPCQYQRNTAGYHHARTNTQAQEAHDEYNDDGFPQRADELSDRLLDHARLVGNLMDFQACRQFIRDFSHNGLQILSQCQDIAARLHRNRYPDGRLPVEIHLWLRRVDIAAFHRSDIPQPQNPSIGGYGHFPNGVHILEHSRDAHIDVIRSCLHLARRRNEILRLQGAHDCLGTDPQLSQLGIFHLNVDLFLLLAQQHDLLHPGYPQQQPAGLFRGLAQFLIGIAIPGHRIDGAVDIVKTVIVIRAINPLRQILFDILAEIADILPGIADLGCIHIIPELDINDRLPRPRFTQEIVEPRHILEPFLQLVRDLLLYLIRCCSRPGHRNHHLADGKLRVFHASQTDVGKDSRDKDYYNKIPDKILILQGKLRKVPHDASPAERRTFSPSRSLCTPAVTTRSPSFSPFTFT